jgi:hypothetical protein
MLIFDLFAGTGSATKAFEDAGHSVIKIELDNQFQADMHVDIMTLTSDALLTRYGRPDFVWASPPCTAFSVASIGHHWNTDHTPKTLAAIQSMKLVAHTRALLEDLRPRLGFVIENPRGKLRKLPMLETLTRHTVTYCAYGDNRMKPTDFVLKLADVCDFWSAVKHRHAYTGHMHQMAAQRIGGVVWERLEPFAPADGYGASWVNRRGLKVDTYHTNKGRVASAYDPLERG